MPWEAHRRNSFRVASTLSDLHVPRVAEAQPWAEISERFQRYSSWQTWLDIQEHLWQKNWE